jgi:hypothetical protein
MMGLEPTTPCLQSRCSSQLSYIPGYKPNRRRRSCFGPAALLGCVRSDPIGEAPAYTASSRPPGWLRADDLDV